MKYISARTLTYLCDSKHALQKDFTKQMLAAWKFADIVFNRPYYTEICNFILIVPLLLHQGK